MSDKIIEHHIKYIETHGYDETVFLTDTEHQRIDHRKLFPFITAEQLKKISTAAFLRTEKGKLWKRDRIRNEIISVSKVNLRKCVEEKPII